MRSTILLSMAVLVASGAAGLQVRVGPLTIEDGGPRDRDGAADGSISFAYSHHQGQYTVSGCVYEGLGPPVRPPVAD